MAEKIDFAHLKAVVPIDSVLAHHAVETRKLNTTYLVVKHCPLPTHTNKDETDTFKVNVIENWFRCWSNSCNAAMGKKGGDVIDLTCALRGIRLPLEAAKLLVQWFPQYGKAPAPNGTNSYGSGAVVIPPHHSAVAETNKPLGWKLKDVTPEHRLIQSRGITVETAMAFGVGFFPGKGSMAGRIVFPLFEGKSLVGYAGRTTLDVTEKNPKWKMPSGLVKSFLYGLERCDPSKVVVIVESPWTVLQLHDEGYHAASLLGRTLTDAQERCLAPFKTICVEMDDDEPGREANEKIAARLKRGGRTVYKALWKR